MSHVTNMIEGKTYRVTAREPDQNKSTKREKRERETTYEIKPYLFACWRVYDILRAFVPCPKHPLANKLFVMFGVNHGVRPLWPLPLPVTLGRPNPAHRRHPHTMGDGSCAWFGRPPTTARVVATAREGEKNVTGWECAAADVWGVY